MEFAFSALVIFLLLLPGIIFNYSYLRGLGRRDGPVAMKKYSEYLVHATIYALILNAVWGVFFTWTVQHWFSWNVQWSALLKLLMGGQQIKEKQIEVIADHLFGMATYLLSLYLVSAILGTATHIIVRKFKLDKKFKIFRPDDPWFYFLSGEILEFPEVKKSWGIESSMETIDPKQLGIFLTAVVDQGEETFLYSGFVWDFGYSHDGTLDWIALRFPVRLPNNEETSPTSTPLRLFQRLHKFIPFRQKSLDNPPTDEKVERPDFPQESVLVLQYDEMSTITLTYLYTRRESESGGEMNVSKM